MTTKVEFFAEKIDEEHFIDGGYVYIENGKMIVKSVADGEMYVHFHKTTKPAIVKNSLMGGIPWS